MAEHQAFAVQVEEQVHLPLLDAELGEDEADELLERMRRAVRGEVSTG